MIGVISDTHGLLRPEAEAALQGSELILHAGDIGDPAVIEALERIAPVHAVRGNIDSQAWASAFPETQFIQHRDHAFYILHNIARLDIDPAAAGIAMVVYGHSHRPLIEQRQGCIFFNPGSAGPRRFSLPISVGRISFDAGGPRAEVVNLEIES